MFVSIVNLTGKLLSSILLKPRTASELLLERGFYQVVDKNSRYKLVESNWSLGVSDRFMAVFFSLSAGLQLTLKHLLVIHDAFYRMLMSTLIGKQQLGFWLTSLFIGFFVIVSYDGAWAGTYEKKDLLPGNLRDHFSSQWFAPVNVQDVSLPYWSFAVSEKYIVAPSTNNTLICLDPDNGVRKWEKPLGPLSNAFPAIGEKSAIVLIDLNRLLAIDFLTGNTKWEFTDGAELGLPTIVKDKVLIGSKSGHIYAISQATGEIVWQHNVGSSAIAKPAALRRISCFGTESGQLNACNIADGKMLWSFSLEEEIALPIVSGKENFFVLAEDDTLYAFSAKTGLKCWHNKADANIEPPFPIMNKLAIFGRLGSFGQYSFLILDRSTGNRIWRGSFNGQLSSLPFSVRNLMFYSAGGSLCVYDVQKGYNLRMLDAPTNLQLARNKDNLFFAVPNKGIWCARINYSELQGAHERMLFSTPKDLFVPATKIVVLLITLLFFFLIFFLPTGKHIPPLHETFLHIRVLTFTLGVLSLISGYVAFLILRHNFAYQISVLGILYSCVLLLPLFIVLCSRYTFSRMVRKRLGDPNTDSTVEEPSILASVRDVCQQMSVPHPVSVVRSSKPDISPFALGSSKRQCWLVIPSNFSSLIFEACDDKPHLVEGLKRLILTHEIAHIRNRDIFTLPILWAIRTPLKLWLTGVVLFYLFARYFTDNALVALVGRPLTGIIILGWLFLIVAMRSVLKAREKLADATATLYVAPQTIKKLTETDKSGLSPLEKLVFSFTAASPFCKSYLGFSARSKPVVRFFLFRTDTYTRFFKKTISSFQVEIGNRLRALVWKTFALTDNVLPTWKTACFVGVAMSLLFSIVRLTKVYTFVDYMLSKYSESSPDILGGFLKAMDTWKYTTQNRILWTPNNELAIKLLICLVAAGLLVMPLRKRESTHNRISRTDIAKLGLIVLLYHLVFSVTTSIINDIAINFSFPSFPGIRFSSAWMFTGLLLAMFFWVCLPISVVRLVSGYLLLIMETVIGLICVFIPLGIILVLNTSLSFTSILLLWLCAVELASILSLCRAPDIVARNEEMAHEGIRYWRLLWQRKILLLPLWQNRFGILPLLKTTSLTFVIMFFLPISAMCIAVYPRLIFLNTWYLANMGRLHETLHDLTETAVDRISSGSWGFPVSVKFALLYLSNLYVGPDKLFPSTAVGFLAACILSFLLASCIGITALRGRRNRIRFIEQMPLLIQLSRILRQKLMTESYNIYLIKKVLPRKPLQRPFVSGIEHMPLMRTTCEAIDYLYQAKIDDERGNWMLKWVDRCTFSGGGFGPMPGMPADVLHTSSALKMLKRIGQMNIAAQETHYRWLQQQIVEKLREAGSLAGREWLSVTECIVSSIAAISSIEKLSNKQVKEIVEISVVKWRESNFCITCTNQLLSILNNLNMAKGSEVLEEIRSTWLPTREQKLPLFKPNSRLREISELVNIIAFLYPESYLKRPAINQVMDNLNKTYARKQQKHCLSR